MLDKVQIYERFAQCHDTVPSAQIAKLYDVSRQTANSWKLGKNPIPLKILKLAADREGVRWDWLLDGKEPQYRRGVDRDQIVPWDRHAINQRFLSLFPEMSQAKIAEELGVSQTSVHRWSHDLLLVSRTYLKHAVDTKGVTWEWLLEGR